MEREEKVREADRQAQSQGGPESSPPERGITKREFLLGGALAVGAAVVGGKLFGGCGPDPEKKPPTPIKETDQFPTPEPTKTRVEPSPTPEQKRELTVYSPDGTGGGSKDGELVELSGVSPTPETPEEVIRQIQQTEGRAEELAGAMQEVVVAEGYEEVIQRSYLKPRTGETLVYCSAADGEPLALGEAGSEGREVVLLDPVQKKEEGVVYGFDDGEVKRVVVEPGGEERVVDVQVKDGQLVFSEERGEETHVYDTEQRKWVEAEAQPEQEEIEESPLVISEEDLEGVREQLREISNERYPRIKLETYTASEVLEAMDVPRNSELGREYEAFFRPDWQHPDWPDIPYNGLGVKKQTRENGVILHSGVGLFYGFVPKEYVSSRTEEFAEKEGTLGNPMYVVLQVRPGSDLSPSENPEAFILAKVGIGLYGGKLDSSGIAARTISEGELDWRYPDEKMPEYSNEGRAFDAWTLDELGNFWGLRPGKIVYFSGLAKTPGECSLSWFAPFYKEGHLPW